MLRAVLFVIATLTLAACAGGPGPHERYGRFFKPVANPSKIVAVELAFARDWREGGAAAAFDEHAKDDAVIFGTGTGRTVTAYLADPAHAGDTNRSWDTKRILISCDGSLAAGQGVTHVGGKQAGVYTNIWEQQPNGTYLLALSFIEPGQSWTGQSDFVMTQVADCKVKSRAEREAAYAANLAEMQRDVSRKGMPIHQAVSQDFSFAYIADHATPDDRSILISVFGENGWQSYADQRRITEKAEAQMQETPQ